MPKTDLILLHPPHVYDFRKVPQLYGPVSDLAHTTPVFEMYPVGFASIAEYLEKNGYRVRIVNLAWRMIRNARFDAEKFISKLKAPVFGIDLHWMVHAHGSVEIARLVKKLHPDSRVIMGGFSASRFSGELIRYPEVDFVMRGDSTEEPMRQFMNVLDTGEFESVPNLSWKDDSGRVHENPLSYVPTDISHVMGNHYGLMVKQVLRYRDLASVVPFKGWLKYPVTAVFTCRGCNGNCVFCGGSRQAMKIVAGRHHTVFRKPEEICKDISNISRISGGLITVLGDIRQPGETEASNLLKLLQKQGVKNTLMFELYNPAPFDFIEQISKAAHGFSLDISPNSHDPLVRQKTGIYYSNKDMEQTINDALVLGAKAIEVFFMIGLPGQDKYSVMDTVNYCEHLLKKFSGNKRLSLFIGPLGPFLDPGSLAFENPDKYGYKLRFKRLEDYRIALTMPSWKHTLNYETALLSSGEIIEATYTAIARLTELKARFNQIPESMAKKQIERINKARQIEFKIDALLNDNDFSGLALLKNEMEEVNNFTAIENWQLKLPVKAFSLRYINSIWAAIRGDK